MGATRHAESTQNNNYAISPQCLKKVVSNEVDFLHTDKHLNFLQVDATFFIVFMYLARPVSSTQKNFYLSDISRTKLEMQLIFCMQGNIKVFNKLILSFLTGVASLPKIHKITSLQYLTNNMLDYLDCRYIHRPPNHESNQLHKCKSKTIANYSFIFSCSEIL